MKHAPTAPRHQMGMTLIEMLVVLIVIIIIIAAAASRIGGVFDKNDTAEEVTNVNSLIVGAKTLRSAGGYGASGADLVPALIATNAVPKTMPVVSGAIKNKWNATVTVKSTGAGFAVTEASVPDAACIELANKVSKGAAVTTKINANTAVTGEVPTATATTQCNASDANSIVFTALN